MRPITFLSLTAALLSAANLPTDKPAPPAEISQLDECIQQRFLDRTSFGMSRIAAPRPSHAFRVFEPENLVEQRIVDRLRRKGFAVAVFLVGRLALADPAASTPRAGLQGPAFVTSPGAQLPDKAALLWEGRRALASIGEREGLDIKKGDWTIAIRPLRASSQACIGCHSFGGTPPKIGEALGVAMYVYRGR